MKILTVCSAWRVFGAETITLKMLEGFQAKGHEQIAVTSIWTDGEFGRRLEQLKICEIAMPIGSVVASLSPRYMKWNADLLVRLPILLWQWNRLMHTFEPDVILWTGGKQPLFLLPFLKQTPSILIEHAELVPTGPVCWLYRRLNRKVKCFVAVSDFMRGFYTTVGVSEGKIRVIKNGVFFEREQAAFRLADDSKDRPSLLRIGIVGRIAHSKGYECLVETVRLIHLNGVKVEIVAFGSGTLKYEDRLKKQIADAGLSGIWKWMGYESERSKIYRSMDICVMPSCQSESFGMVAAEASAYGLPVVASRIGGLPEIIEDGVTGYLVEPNSPKQLAEKIQYLINHPETASEMGRAGRERVFKHFTVEKMVMAFESLFNEFVPPAHE
jgi:glycosyltransferase involved in cell wall biosynthesis